VDVIMPVIPLLLTFSLALLVVAAGLASSRGDFTYVVSRPALLLKAFEAIMLIPVLTAMLVIAFLPLSPAVKAAILLMAFSPVPPLMPGKALETGGHSAYVYGLMTTGAIFALVFVPILGALAANYYHVHAQFPLAVVARNIAGGVVIPLAIGLALGRWLLKDAAPRLTRGITILAHVLLVVAAVPLLVGVWPQMMMLIGDGAAMAMALVVFAALVGGHVLGGDTIADRSSLAITASLRHPGIALALAGANHADKAVSAAALLFLVIGFLLLIPYLLLLRLLVTTEA
jgi:predicted Na+-dependent transporter